MTRANENAPETRSLDGLRVTTAQEDLAESASLAPIAPSTDTPAGEDRGRRGWAGRLALAGLGLLAATGLGALGETLVREVLALGPWYHWAALGGLGLTLVALLLWLGHEWRGVRRLARLATLQGTARAGLAGDPPAAEEALDRLERLYAPMPAREWALAAYRERAVRLKDPIDRLPVFEQVVLGDIDRRAAAAVSRAVRRVAAGTAVSPFAALDMAVTLVLDLRLAAEIARLYGGRPGSLATLKLLRRAFFAMLSAGAIEAADDALGDMLGVGIAGRLSGKAGAALANGFLTARLGLAAIDACRPMPWHARPRPRARTLAAGALKRDTDQGSGP